MTMSEELLYYVNEGQMCNGKILSVFEINLENKGPFSDREVLNSILSGDRVTTHIVDNLITLSKHQRVALMSGMKLVPIKDLYETKRAAADAYHEELLAEEKV